MPAASLLATMSICRVLQVKGGRCPTTLPEDAYQVTAAALELLQLLVQLGHSLIELGDLQRLHVAQGLSAVGVPAGVGSVALGLLAALRLALQHLHEILPCARRQTQSRCHTTSPRQEKRRSGPMSCLADG